MNGSNTSEASKCEIKKAYSFSLKGLPPQIHDRTPLLYDFPILIFYKDAVPRMSPLSLAGRDPFVRSAYLFIEFSR
jgi:hypothetical protein